MVVYKCDRCQREFKDIASLYSVKITDADGEKLPSPEMFGLEKEGFVEVDLCQDCIQRIVNCCRENSANRAATPSAVTPVQSLELNQGGVNGINTVNG